ncbi:hypothetical protein Droror1_Dr00007190 [Drosera rotundifolia]
MRDERSNRRGREVWSAAGGGVVGGREEPRRGEGEEKKETGVWERGELGIKPQILSSPQPCLLLLSLASLSKSSSPPSRRFDFTNSGSPNSGVSATNNGLIPDLISPRFPEMK